jgi:predicted dehydrogenase
MNRRNFIGNVGKGALAIAAMPSMRALGANDRIRIGLIGAGDRGMQDLADALKQPNIECVAVADTYSRRRDLAKTKVPGIDTYDDPMRLLERKDIDAVINATPMHLHAKYFIAALAAGKDLYSEKTMTWNIPQAVACRKAAQASKQVLQIGVQFESSGGLADARDWVNKGYLGKVTMVESWISRNTPHGHGQWVRPIPADCDLEHVNWKLFLDGRPEPKFDANKYINWRLFWEFSGGNVTENMVHQIAWIMSALDLSVPAAASMSGGVFSEKDGRQVPDTISVTLEFPEKDVVVTWQSSFSNSRYGLGEHILGSDGTIEHVAGATEMVTGKSEERIEYYPEKVNRPDGAAAKGETPSQNHMANWIDCIRTRATPNAPVEIGYRSAIAAHMSNMAYRQKRRITWEEAKAAQPEY